MEFKKEKKEISINTLLEEENKIMLKDAKNIIDINFLLLNEIEDMIYSYIIENADINLEEVKAKIEKIKIGNKLVKKFVENISSKKDTIFLKTNYETLKELLANIYLIEEKVEKFNI